jgi:hypothetical protein
MTEPLRPLSIGELLDRTFSLYRQNFKLFIGVAILGPAAMLCFQIVMLVLGLGGRNARAMVQNPGWFFTVFTLGAIFYLIGYAISAAASIRAVGAVYLGKTITIGEAYASVKGRIFRLIMVMIWSAIVGMGGAYLLILLGVAIFAGGVAGGRALSGTAGMWIGGAIGVVAIIACALAAIGWVVRYALSVQSCVLENLKVGASLKRSKALTKGDRTRVVTIGIVCTAIAFVVGMICGLPGAFIPVKDLVARQAVTHVFSLIASALCAPLFTVAMSLLYYDERVRKEAFDLQLMMDSLDMPAPPQTATPTPSLG